MSPVAWVRANLMRGVVIVENVSASIEPEVVIVMTPIVPGADGSSAANGVVVSDTQGVAMAAESLITPLPDPNDTPQAEQSILAAAVQAQPFGVGGPQPSSDITALKVEPPSTPTQPPATDTPMPTETPVLPTPTLAPTLVPTDAPETEGVVEEGAPEASENRAGGMAAALAASGPANTPTPTWTALATSVATAAGESMQVAALAANQTTLPTATATPTPAVTPLPTATPTPVVYQVRSGDTLVTIAAEYDVEVDALMAANDISEEEVYAIQPGQLLIVPVATPERVSVAVTDPSTVRLETPALLVPPDGSVVGCATGGKLIWQRVQFVKDSDFYVLHLGFVSGGSNGEEVVTWVLAQSSPVTQTDWQLDTSLCDLAPDDFGREWRWWVEVVAASDVARGGETVSVSPPSEVWGFTWE
jgi:LysM repeat protein